MKFTFVCLLSLGSLCIIHAQTNVERDFSQFFKAYHVEGSFIMLDITTGQYLDYQPEWNRKGFLPASTYKILNSLIGLETGVIQSPDFVIPWDSVERWNPEWNRDHSLRTAFKVSCVPYYQELARRVGLKKMKNRVAKTHYGQMDIQADNLDEFWLMGNSRITPLQQIDFLFRLIQNKLPFSKKNQLLVKEIMLDEQQTDYTIRAKTGWTKQDGKEIGWYVGYLEKKDNVYVFATRIETTSSDNPLFNRARKEITLKILKELSLIP